jgi:hypothetical protein
MKTNAARLSKNATRETEHKRLVTHLLEHHGFSVTSVRMDEWCNGHRPDLVARQNREIFTIVLQDSEAQGRSLNGAGGCLATTRPVNGSARVTSATAGTDFGRRVPIHAPGPSTSAEPFHLSWVLFHGDNAALEADRARARLYGTVALAELGLAGQHRAGPAPLGNHPRCHQCYYYANSAFSRHRDTLDAVVLSRPGRLILCINSLSSKASRFRASSMARAFSESLVDPDRWERSRIAFILDPAFDRQNDALCLEHLRHKYGTGPLVVMRESLPASGDASPAMDR